METEKKITFEDLPQAVSFIMNKLVELGEKVDGLSQRDEKSSNVKWMNTSELIDYLPTHPARQTIYVWTSTNMIPYHKRGRRIMFLKDEIDEWMVEDKRKSREEILKEAETYVKANKQFNPIVRNNII